MTLVLHNKVIIIRDKNKSSSIEFSLGIDAGFSQPLTSQSVPSLMDLEPGRCRRTDGKKWRCRLAVLPDKKYCERHIHRGRLRLRKPVKVHKTFSTSNSTTTTPISSLKATPNLQSAMKGNARNHNKVHIKNQSFKIKKHSRENAHAPLELSFSPISVLQHDNAGDIKTSKKLKEVKHIVEKELTLPVSPRASHDSPKDKTTPKQLKVVNDGLPPSFRAKVLEQLKNDLKQGLAKARNFKDERKRIETNNRFIADLIKDLKYEG